MPETPAPPPALERVRIGIVSISDRASSGVYEDKGLPALRDWLGRALRNPIDWEPRLIADEQALISQTLIELVDLGCDLVLTTGGTGPAKRDVTPEATLAVADKEMPGFGEQMRQISLRFVPTAILSRQVAVIRGQSLIINLPGQPKSIAETLEGLKDEQGQALVHGIFAAVPYCVDLIGGPYIETDDAVCKAFRPGPKRVMSSCWPWVMWRSTWRTLVWSASVRVCKSGRHWGKACIRARSCGSVCCAAKAWVRRFSSAVRGVHAWLASIAWLISVSKSCRSAKGRAVVSATVSVARANK